MLLGCQRGHVQAKESFGLVVGARSYVQMKVATGPSPEKWL